MPQTLAQRQLAQTKKESDATIRKRAREKLRRLRDGIRAAKKARAVKLKDVGANCRTARTTISARAKQARARLNDSIKRTREKARTLCSTARGDARIETLSQIDHAVGLLQEELTEQRRLSAWTRKPAKKGGAERSSSRLERRGESDDEVAANIDDPGLRIVWEHVRHKIKGGKHRSRTEAFAEWAAEHVAQVYAIQEADAERHLQEMERAERKLAGALRKPGNYREPAGLEAVPF